MAIKKNFTYEWRGKNNFDLQVLKILCVEVTEALGGDVRKDGAIGQYGLVCTKLTLKVLNFWKFTSYCSLKPLWSGMGE